MNDLKSKPNKTDRQLKLDAWLTLNQIAYRDLAHTLGVSPAFIGHIFSGKRPVPAKRYEQLKGLGIPEEILPQPRARARGNPSESGE